MAGEQRVFALSQWLSVTQTERRNAVVPIDVHALQDDLPLLAVGDAMRS
jgi:hypothetical protein